MVDTNKIRGLMAEQRKTQEQTARAIGMTPKTFYNKLRTGVFGTDEAERLIEYLHIEQPAAIFFANKGT